MRNQQVNSREARMLAVAAELLQTLQDLHSKAGIAHLDLTSSNVMLSANGGLWDHIRLIDFGFAQTCSSDPNVADILPVGATLYFGSPEQLRSLQLQIEGCYDQSAKINGPACDLWSVGVVLYFLMTGDLPFEPKRSLKRAPRYLSKADGELWEGYEAMGAVHNTWEEAVHSAEAAGTPASHPIIDRIRACSSTPDLAANFFLCLLCPQASNRATAVNMVSHPYCHVQCLEAHVAFLQRLVEEKGAKIRAAHLDPDRPAAESSSGGTLSASESSHAEQPLHQSSNHARILSSTATMTGSCRSSIHSAQCPSATDSSWQHISKLAKLKQWLRMVAETFRLPQGLSLVKAFFVQLFSMERPVCSDQNQQAGASQHRAEESSDSCSVSFAKSVSAKADRVSNDDAASSSQYSHAVAASRSGLISALTSSASARTTTHTRRQQPPRLAAASGLSTKFVAAVDDEESSLVFGFPGALGKSDGAVGGDGGLSSGRRAQQKASSPPAASVKSRSGISAWWKRSMIKLTTISHGIATNSINLI
ncbi:TPA: hypothetical protein ACH3X2_012092 [Trebouxia sp. C0005]